jgi:hypothetical protein
VSVQQTIEQQAAQAGAAGFAIDEAEYGGERTPYLAGGDVPAGTIYTNGPCEPGDYRWEVVALDRLGSALATAHRARPFP